MCDELMLNKPYHVVHPEKCKGSLSKVARGRRFCGIVSHLRCTLPDHSGSVREASRDKVHVQQENLHCEPGAGTSGKHCACLPHRRICLQVCDLSGHRFSTNRTFISENIDDYIWKNLSMCESPAQHSDASFVL
jgi:hypothetical protein